MHGSTLVERKDRSRLLSQSRPREFYEDSPSSSSSASAPTSTRPSPQRRAANDQCSEAIQYPSVSDQRTASAALPSTCISATSMPTSADSLRRRHSAFTALATSHTSARPPSRGPVPRLASLIPRALVRQRCQDERDTSDSMGVNAPAQTLSAMVVETGRRAMEDEVLHWRHRCRALESELVATVAALDTARGALTQLQRTAAVCHTGTATSSPHVLSSLGPGADEATVMEARRWRAMANAFLSSRPDAERTASAVLSEQTSTGATTAPTRTSPQPPLSPESPLAPSLFSVERERTPYGRQDLAAHSLSPPTPAYPVCERLLSAGSPSLTPPAPFASDASSNQINRAREIKATEEAAPLANMEAAEAAACTTSASSSPDSQALRYDATDAPSPAPASGASLVLSATEQEKAKAALASIQRSQGAVAPTPTKHPTPSTSPLEGPADAGVRRVEAELSALRMERDTLETTLLSTQEQLIRLQEEARAAASPSPPTQPPSRVFATTEQASALVRRLRHATWGASDDQKDSVDADEREVESCDAPACWDIIVHEMERLIEGTEKQRMQLLEVKEELHIVREDRNELMGQQSEPVRRLQERLLEREQANVRLMEELAEREQTISALAHAKTELEDAFRLYRAEHDTFQLDRLKEELVTAKQALQIKETALRIALRESIQDTLECTDAAAAGTTRPSGRSSPLRVDRGRGSAGPTSVSSPQPQPQPTTSTTAWSPEPRPLRERVSPNVPTSNDSAPSREGSENRGRSVSLGGSTKGAAAALRSLAILLSTPTALDAAEKAGFSRVQRDTLEGSHTRLSANGGGDRRAGSSTPTHHNTSHRSGAGASEHSPVSSLEGSRGSSALTGGGPRRTIRTADADVMSRHRELWRQHEAQYHGEGRRGGALSPH